MLRMLEQLTLSSLLRYDVHVHVHVYKCMCVFVQCSLFYTILYCLYIHVCDCFFFLCFQNSRQAAELVEILKEANQQINSELYELSEMAKTMHMEKGM